LIHRFWSRKFIALAQFCITQARYSGLDEFAKQALRAAISRNSRRRYRQLLRATGRQAHPTRERREDDMHMISRSKSHTLRP